MKKFFYSALALVAIAGCAKDVIPAEEVVPQGETVTITAAMAQTKTTESAGTFSWNSDETISVGTADEEYVAFDVDNAETGTFKHTFDAAAPELLLAVSPAQTNASFGDASIYEVELPAIYNDYVQGQTNALMIGTPDPQTANKFLFSHAAALIKVTYANVPAGTAGFKLTADANITGTVTLGGTSVSDIEIANTNADLDGKEVYINLAQPVAEAGGTLSFYVPVPTGNYSLLTIALMDSKGEEIASSVKTMNREGKTPLTLARTDVFNFPTITLEDVTIPINTSTQENPYSAAEAKELAKKLDENTVLEGVYVSGIISKIVTAYNAEYKNVTFSISATGLTTDDQFDLFRVPAESAKVYEVGDAIEFKGTLKNYKGTTPELAASFTEIYKYKAPSFSVAEGEYTSEQTVSLSADNGATIYYTLDNSNPTTESSVYSVPIAVSESVVIKAFAVNNGVSTGVVSAVYTIVDPDSSIDVITRATTGISGTAYSNWSDKTVVTNAVYAGNSAGGNDAIQLRSNNNNSGIVSTTSGGYVKNVTVSWDSNTASERTLNIYGKNSAYTSAEDLYTAAKAGTLLGTIVNGTSTSLTVSGNYQFIGIRSASGAIYLTNVSIEWSDEAADLPKYDVTVSPSDNGSVTANPTKAFEGETVALSINPDAGYQLSSLTVNEVDVTSDVEDDAYSFSMPAANVTVAAVFEEIPSGTRTYTITWNSNNNSESIGSYTDNWSVTADGLTCNMANWNNNNNSWKYVKAGRKNVASVATIVTASAIPEAIKTITLSIDALTVSKINSIKLYVSDSSTFGSTAAGTFTAAVGDQSIVLSAPAANKYYKIEVDCASGSSNGLIQVSKLVFTTE